MQALVRHGMGDDDIRLEEVPEPSPAPHEVKIQVKAAGLCGTDVHGHPAVRPPVILGHELAGVIVEVGADCSTRHVGDRVTSETTRSRCGTCRFCREGPVSMCINRTGMASNADGCFARYVTIPESSTHVLPAGVGFAAGALTEPLACATHAVIEQAGVGPGEFILVVGPGPVGLLVAWCCAILRARVVVAGTAADAERLELAAGLGAERVINVQAEDVVQTVKSMTDGYGADTAFECSGAAAAVPPAIASLRKRGRYVQVGILHDSVELDFDDVFFSRELTLAGSHTSNPVSWTLALNLMAAGKLDLRRLISAELPLAEWRRAFGLVRARRAVKVVLTP
jgi:L-iditol 2-dehydrogenase